MPRFVQLSGTRTGESWPAAEGTVLGRDASCEVVLVEPSVSRRHARLVHRGGEWRLVDMASRNGLFLAGRRVESAVLRGGEELRLGKLRLRFHLDDAGDRLPPELGSEVAREPAALTRELRAPTDADEATVPLATSSVAERRALHLAELRRESGGRFLGGDLLQRPAWVRWAVYLAALAASAGAAWGAFRLILLLRG